MNPTKVQTDTKRNPETVYDDNPSSKWFPRGLWTGLQIDMNPAKVQTDTKRNPEIDFDDNLSRKYTQENTGQDYTEIWTQLKC